MTANLGSHLQQKVPARWAVFSGAVLALLIFSFWLRAASPIPGQPAPAALRASSVAVLPFVNASPDVADDYLGHGLSAELTEALSAVGGVQVGARSSAFAPRQVAADPRLAGRRMGVATVLLGSVRRSGDRLRVTARLVDVQQGFDIWSEAYERQIDEMFDIEAEIRSAVAGALRATAVGDSAFRQSRPTASFLAHDAYLAGRYELEQSTPGSNRRAQAHLARAVGLDSTFARAHAALAEAYMRGGGIEAMSPLTAAPLARASAVRAMAIDSNLARAHSTLGTIQFLFDRNWGQAEVQFRRSLALDSTDTDLIPPYARFLLAMGRNDESESLLERALDLSPLSPELIHQLGWHYLHTRQYDRAREFLQRASALDSTAWQVDADLAALEQATGDYPAAEARLQRALAAAPQRAELLAAAAQLQAVRGQTEAAKALLEQLRALATDRYISSYLLAGVEASLGRRTDAFASLSRAVKERSELVPYLRIDLRVDSLRTDRRFPRLLRQLRLP